MATVTKAFHFATSTEGWVATPGHAQVNMAWFPPHKSRGTYNLHNSHGIHQTNPLLSVMGGCLRTTARAGASSANNYWEWTGTWESLGVPVGATVTGITADYLYRVDLKGHSQTNHSDAVYNTSKIDTLRSGGFELRDSGGSLLNILVSSSQPPGRSSGGAKAYPVGSQSDLVALRPVSWENATGVLETVAAPNQASGTTIKLRLKSLTPGLFVATKNWIRLKQDYVNLVITYTPAAAGSSNFFLNL